MRKQNEQVMAYIKDHFRSNNWWACCERSFWNLHVEVCKDWFKIYYYKTCLVSYSDISHDVIFDCWNWHTVSTAQNLKAFVEWIFDFTWKPKWKWIIDNYWQEYTRERNGKIYIQPISYLYL